MASLSPTSLADIITEREISHNTVALYCRARPRVNDPAPRALLRAKKEGLETRLGCLREDWIVGTHDVASYNYYEESTSDSELEDPKEPTSCRHVMSPLSCSCFN